MCGLAGFLDATSARSSDEALALLRPMADSIRLRGPDSDGYWADPSAGIGLAHRRLAIVDLTAAGHQPMLSASGRYVIVLNGEIYNHGQIRQALQQDGLAPVWRGHSDTETLLAAIDVWGLPATLQRCIGMFAIALWCRQTRSLMLARDRLGEKPLYYGWQGSGQQAVFLFGSELKALRAHPACARQIDRSALAYFMQFNRVGGTQSIYQGLHKLQPGCWMSVSQAAPTPVVHCYWSVAEVARQGLASPFVGSAEDAIAALDTLLSDAVGQQMMADVPLGAFLSGGIDSSLIVALMQKQSSRPVKTFSIGFNEAQFNEAQHAKAVAKHLGTDHTELYVTADQAMAVIPRLPSLYCEPFADSSQIPTFLVSQLARQHVTVSLSGDAGDELFCGYRRYQFTARVWQALGKLPLPLRRLAARLLTTPSAEAWNRLLSVFTRRRAGDQLHKAAAVLASRSVDDLYRNIVVHWSRPGDLVLGAAGPDGLVPGQASAVQGLGEIDQMMLIDLLSYLPDDILVKVDRAAMGVSLETRVPFLDHRVVEFAASLPLALKRRDGEAKWPLRQLLYRHVPKALVDRPKMGFGVPVGDWLRGPLRDWAEPLLSDTLLRQQGFLHAAPIRRKWAEHLSGHRDWQAYLWDVLMFQAWLEQEQAA